MQADSNIKRKKKILLFSPRGLDNGGVQHVIMDIVRSLHLEYQFDIYLLTQKEGYFDKEFMSFGGTIYRGRTYEGNNRIAKEVDYCLRGIKIKRDIVDIINKNGPYFALHCHNQFEAGVCVSVAKNKGVPIRIVHAHSINRSKNPIRFLVNIVYKKLITTCATNYIGCTKEAATFLFGKKLKCEVIYNPFDEKKFFYKEIEKQKSSFNLIQIARFDQNKNQMFALDVFTEIKKKYNNSRMFFLGFGDNLKLKEHVKKRQLNDSVFFYPGSYNASVLISESSALLLPSFTEGFGIVLVEAQAMGLRCFVSDSVPKDADCGGCTFLPLNIGASEWSEYILSEYKKGNLVKKRYDCSKFSTDTFKNCIRTLYGGEDKDA